MNNHQLRVPEAVAQQIKSMIIELSLSEGEKLPTESALTHRFQVSRSSVREAVKILEAENVVEIRHGRGTFIATKTGIAKDPLGLSFADRETLLSNMLEARRLMEPGIVRLAAQRRTRENLRQMLKSIHDMEAAQRRGEDYTAYDYRFHCILAESTQNDVLERVLPLICDSINAGYMQTAQVKGSYEKAVYWHRRIYEAILAQKPAEAEEALNRHLQQTLIDAEQNTGGETS